MFKFQHAKISFKEVFKNQNIVWYLFLNVDFLFQVGVK
jgi:hypothetical protein